MEQLQKLRQEFLAGKLSESLYEEQREQIFNSENFHQFAPAREEIQVSFHL